MIESDFDDWSEEDLRTRVIYPLLTELGFQPGEIKVEVGFQVRIGHGKVTLPRADMLVSREGKHLFVVECKHPDHKFTTKDREQAISYARLVQPQIAPLALLTTGNRTEMLDALTGQSIDLVGRTMIESWKSVGMEDALRVRTEAISQFLCLSASNLLDFTKQELDRIANRSSLRPSYEPSHHVPRTGISAELNRQCADGSGQITVLVGASTIGKSSEILASAHSWLCGESREVFPLYVPLNLSGPDFLAYLTETFGWQFHGIDTAAELVATIDRIALKHGIKCVAYLLDGGDIVDLDDLRCSIERFLGNAETLSCRHRVVLSLQASTWGYLRDGRGIDLSRRMSEPELRLEPLDRAQQLALRAKLERRYGISLARLPHASPVWSRPALMAIAASLIAENGETGQVSVAELWRAFLELQLKKSKSRSGVVDALTRLVEGETSDGERVYLDDAVAVGILDRIEGNHFRQTYVFCEEWIRYYLQCFVLWRLDDATPERIWEIVVAITDPSQRRALEWYEYNIGGDDRWRLVAERTHLDYLEIMRSLTRRIGAICVDANVTLCFAPGVTPAIPWFSLVPGREPMWVDRKALPDGARIVHAFAPFARGSRSAAAVHDAYNHLRHIAQWLCFYMPDLSRAQPQFPCQLAVYKRLTERLVGPFYSMEDIAATMLGKDLMGAEVVKDIFTQGISLARAIAEEEFGAFASRLPRRLRIELDVSDGYDHGRLYQMRTGGNCVEVDVVVCRQGDRSHSWGYDWATWEQHGVDSGGGLGLARKLIAGDWIDPLFQYFSWRSPKVWAMKVPAVANVARAFLEDLLNDVKEEDIRVVLNVRSSSADV